MGALLESATYSPAAEVLLKQELAGDEEPELQRLPWKCQRQVEGLGKAKGRLDCCPIVGEDIPFHPKKMNSS